MCYSIIPINPAHTPVGSYISSAYQEPLGQLRILPTAGSVNVLLWFIHYAAIIYDVRKQLSFIRPLISKWEILKHIIKITSFEIIQTFANICYLVLWPVLLYWVCKKRELCQSTIFPWGHRPEKIIRIRITEHYNDTSLSSNKGTFKTTLPKRQCECMICEHMIHL